MYYLCEALLPGCADFGDGGDDFTSTSWRHHLGGQDCDWTVGTCTGRGFIHSFIRRQNRLRRSYVRVCVSPVPAPACSADTGMVLIMVVPGFEVAGVTPRMVDLADADAACAVLRMVVCLPSADVTSFKMVPAGRAPFA